MKTTYQKLAVVVSGHVAYISFNRPDKMNALDAQSWQELSEVMQEADQDGQVRAIVLSGQGKHFCAGIDLSMLMGMQKEVASECEGRKREKMRKFVLDLQETINSIEKCRKPVIASVHGACIGGGLDIIAACDMRYASQDAFFSLKEIDLGIVADLGVLQRLPYIIGEGMVREMAFTARNVSGEEAQQIHLVNKTFASKEELQEQVQKIAQQIAAKPPLVSRGVKEVLNYSRDNTVANGLNYVALWNAATIISDDLSKAMQAQMTKTQPEFMA